MPLVDELLDPAGQRLLELLRTSGADLARLLRGMDAIGRGLDQCIDDRLRCHVVSTGDVGDRLARAQFADEL